LQNRKIESAQEVVNLLNFIIVVPAVHEGECREKSGALGSSRLEDHGLHFCLVLGYSFQIVVEEEYFAWLELLD